MAPKSYGIVDDRREEVDGLHDGQVVCQAIHGRVVARVEPHEQVVVLHVGEMAQDLAEVLGAELTGSTRAGSQTGQADFFLLHGVIIDAGNAEAPLLAAIAGREHPTSPAPGRVAHA